MIKTNKRCGVCQAILKDTRLKTRIYNSRFYVPSSDDTLMQIAKDNAGKFNYSSLLRHVKVHQLLTEKQKTNKNLHNIVRKTKKKEIERDIASKAVVAAELVKGGAGVSDTQPAAVVVRTEADKANNFTQVWDTIIEDGLQKLKDGKLHITTGQLLAASRDKALFEEKKKDRQLAMMEMVAYFASGEFKKGSSHE